MNDSGELEVRAMDPLTHHPGRGTDWLQATLGWETWQQAERVAVAQLAPWLTSAEHDKVITSWWFTRKGATWRIRLMPALGQEGRAANLLDQLRSGLLAQQLIQRWTPTRYEPEIHAFGGAAAMDIAHQLFHADSHHVLAHLRQIQHGDPQDRRRELGLVLTAALMRAAEQDWYEQGDIWAQVAAHRTVGAVPTSGRGTRAAVHRLITAQPAASEWHPDWMCWRAAFEQTGRRLADLCRAGSLTRGIRGILSHHVLFAWNRAGIPAHHQALLATAASNIIFDQEPIRTVPEHQNP